MIALAATVTAVVSIYTGAASLGLDLPRPAWNNEVQKVSEDQKRTERDVINMQLDDVQLRIYQNLREQNIYEQGAEPVPNYLLQEKTDLESKKRRLEDRLEGLNE